MAFRTVGVLLTADATQMKAGLLGASREVQNFDRQVSTAGANVSRTSQLMGTAFKATGVAVAAGLAYSIKSAVDFESAMRNVNSISRLSEEAFKAQGAAVLDLSRQLPQSAQTLAEGLYEIASSGFQGAEGLEVLEQSAKAASAGLTTTDNAAKAITAVLNAYGRSADDAADVSDVLFQTVNLGVISFEELTGVIADVAGTASAAGVDIAQVGAAIATMTLAGISADEAGTSLNRVLQSLIQPSDELATVYESVGIESGAAALEQIGLRGVMEKLQGAVGGNVEAWLQLFPEIRAARGALALTNNEMVNYNRVAPEVEDKNKRLAATQKALDEQMKATGAQFKVFLNNINAAAVEGGTKLLPFLLAALKGMRELGSDALPLIIAAAERASPLFRLLGDIIGDLASVGGDVASALAPLAGMLLAVGGAAVLGGLTAVASGLASITGFLADHPGLVEAVAIAYGVKLVAALAGAAASWATLAADKAAIALYEAAGAADAASGKFSTLSGVLKGLSAVVGVALLVGIVDALQEADEAADKLSSSLKEGLDLSTLAGVEEHLKRIQAAQQRLAQETPKGVIGFLTGLADALPFVENGYFKAAAAADKFRRDEEAAAEASVHLSENLAAVSRATGMSADQVRHLASSLGVDLTKSFGESAPGREKMISDWRAMATEAVGGGEAMARAALMPIEELQRLKDAVDETAKKTAEAFTSATSIIANFDPGKANLGDFLRQNLKDAETFVAQIRATAARGLDPKLIQDLLEAGPAKARPFLDAVAADHSGGLIRLANKTNEELGKLSATAVELARVTHRGVNATSQEMAGNFDTAMAILRAKAELGAGATAQAIATKLNMGVADVERIGREYVITWAGSTGTMPGVAADTARATADQIRAKFAELPAFSSQIGRNITGGFTDGLTPIIPNTVTMSDAVKTQWHAVFGALPQFTTEQAHGITEGMRIGLDPMTPKTEEQAIGTANILKWHLQALPPEVQAASASVVRSWLEQLAGAIAPTDANTAAWVTSVAANLDQLLAGVGKPLIGPAVAGAAAKVASFVGLAEGGTLPKDSGMAPPGTLVQWAEPETQGEYHLFVPRSGNKREKAKHWLGVAADDFDLSLVPRDAYAAGGKRGGLDARFLSQIDRWSDAVGGLTIVSGLRSREEQAALYARYKAGTGNLAAPPGTSKHEKGLAIDHSPSGWDFAATADPFDIAHPVAGESWHAEPGWALGGGGGGAPAIPHVTIPPPPDFSAYGTMVGRTATDSTGHTYDVVKQWVAETEAQMAADAAAANRDQAAGGPAPAGALNDWIAEALRITGKPADWAAGLYARAMQESGGNPRAINNWDSNAAKGTPSKGLMQTIEPTFRAYMEPGYGDIWNPVHNMAAAINYIASRYGSPYNLPKGGYSEGGILQFHDGGVVPGHRGQDVLGMLRAGERVVTEAQDRRVGPGVGTPQRLHPADVKAITQGMAVAMTKVKVEVGAGRVSQVQHQQAKAYR